MTDKRIGNHFWMMRSKHGPNVTFSDPAKLQEACLEYFKWIEENPLIEEKVGFSKGQACRANVARIRAMTIGGLSIFLGVTHRSWLVWRKEREDLLPVMEWAEEIIRDQKFTGAAAGLLNANIISRDLGLADKQIHDLHIPQFVINPPKGDAPPEPPVHD